jgi:translation initiation factor IF-1
VPEVSIGKVVELLPGGLVRVELLEEDRRVIKAHVAEEYRRVSAPVKPGDRVRVKIAPNDPGRGTIVGVVMQ